MVNVVDSIENTFATINALVAVTELESLVDPRGGPTGNRGSVELISDEIHLDRGIATTVYDLPRLHRLHGVLSCGRQRRRHRHGALDGEGLVLVVVEFGRKDRSGISGF